MKKFVVSFLGIIAGVCLGYFLVFYTSLLPFRIQASSNVLLSPLAPKRNVVGFLPYWLLNYASTDYSKYITTLTYFGLRIDTDGTIQKLTAPTQTEPGWNALISGKVDPFLQSAKNNGVSLSLLVASGDNQSIDKLMENPILHARNFVKQVTPILLEYNFKDLNLDIEYTQTATPDARTNFTKFVEEVRKNLKSNISLTVEITGNDVIRSDLINPKAMGRIADYVVLMAYDYHSPSSFVSGPVAPLTGAGITSEYDVISAAEKAITQIPNNKLILGVPLYGYEWETLIPKPRSANIPNSGVVASNRRAEDFAVSCSNCKEYLDKDANEKYIAFYDASQGSYHIIYYPDRLSTISKINLANNLSLGGIALWALGYEGKTILNPLTDYVN